MDKFRKIIAEAAAEKLAVSADEVSRVIRIPDPEHGDFAIPCFPFAKQLKQPPPKIAEALAQHLNETTPMTTVAAGPYVNVRVSDEAILNDVLPEVRVDEAKLVDILRWLDREPHVVRDMQRNVAADARLWSWSWQSDVFKRELHAMLSEQSYRPAADFSYLPSWVLEFEKVRCETSCRNEISEESRRSEQMRAAVA